MRDPSLPMETLVLLVELLHWHFGHFSGASLEACLSPRLGSASWRAGARTHQGASSGSVRVSALVFERFGRKSNDSESTWPGKQDLKD
ncbi:hypothetical protein O181_101709 [Austropuccinia psidii MF-1]|uniref:Uncharacterized protein n=1 Tax=Austropuccinia psidii MF-1 TaxID=1389203 RepID=A0A9Q3PHK2_9BASI|nr:hypothetical protein [Austropuccinia psidii MF-1]